MINWLIINILFYFSRKFWQSSVAKLNSYGVIGGLQVGLRIISDTRCEAEVISASANWLGKFRLRTITVLTIVTNAADDLTTGCLAEDSTMTRMCPLCEQWITNPACPGLSTTTSGAASLPTQCCSPGSKVSSYKSEKSAWLTMSKDFTSPK